MFWKLRSIKKTRIAKISDVTITIRALLVSSLFEGQETFVISSL